MRCSQTVPGRTSTDYNAMTVLFYNKLFSGAVSRNVKVVGSSPIKGPRCSLSKKLYPYHLVLVGSRNRFERDFTIELK